nr:MAG TPA: YopX protein [Caudoviricetes sp.]
MREIKFRAWVKDRKAIFEVILIDYVSKKVTYIVERTGHLLNIRHDKFNDIELMQYTGLKDKNNKEIYDGDIIFLHGSKYKVIFKTEGARFVLRNNEFELEITFINNNNKRMEVLGNVYENPELMEDE